MTTSQRSESINAFVKKYVTKKTMLQEFFTQFERGISHQRQLELTEQHHTLNGRPKLKCKMSMEKQMSEIFSRKKFYEFQEQVVQTL